MFNKFRTVGRSGLKPDRSGLSVKGINTAALAWGAHRLMAGSAPDLRDVAVRSWELHPAEIQDCRPAIFLPNALDRISSLSPWRGWETEKLFINGGQIEHAATSAHLLEDIRISDAFLYRGAARMQAGFGAQQYIRNTNAPTTHLTEAHLISNWAGSHYFGMFLRAAIPMELLPEEGAPAISVKTKHYMHEKGYRDILSMPRPRLLTNARIDQLTIYTDFGQNTSKAMRYAKLRRRLRQTLRPNTPPPPGIYLKRGSTGEDRIVQNEAELEAMLLERNFDIVEPSKISAQEVAQRLLDTPIVVSVEGSHMAHAIYTLAEGGTLLALQPPDRFAMAFKELTDRIGLRFAFTVGHMAPVGFRVDIDDLKRTLDILAENQAQNPVEPLNTLDLIS
ncbi:MAG: glycosyltransferase family 61 protein [Roseobacter sp.]